MRSNTVFVMKTKKEKTKFRMHLRNRFFFLDFGPGEVSARHTDFHSILVLLGGIFLSEVLVSATQCLLYDLFFVLCKAHDVIPWGRG